MADEIKPAPAVAGTLVRDVLVVVAALPILIKLIGARDLNSILHWLQSSDGATFIAVVAPLIASGWRAWSSYRTKQALLARPAPTPAPVEP